MVNLQHKSDWICLGDVIDAGGLIRSCGACEPGQGPREGQNSIFPTAMLRNPIDMDGESAECSWTVSEITRAICFGVSSLGTNALAAEDFSGKDKVGRVWYILLRASKERGVTAGGSFMDGGRVISSSTALGVFTRGTRVRCRWRSEVLEVMINDTKVGSVRTDSAPPPKLITRDSLNPRHKKNFKKRGGNPLVREEEEDSADDFSEDGAQDLSGRTLRFAIQFWGPLDSVHSVQFSGLKEADLRAPDISQRGETQKQKQERRRLMRKSLQASAPPPPQPVKVPNADAFTWGCAFGCVCPKQATWNREACLKPPTINTECLCEHCVATSMFLANAPPPPQHVFRMAWPRRLPSPQSSRDVDDLFRAYTSNTAFSRSSSRLGSSTSRLGGSSKSCHSSCSSTPSTSRRGKTEKHFFVEYGGVKYEVDPWKLEAKGEVGWLARKLAGHATKILKENASKEDVM